MIFLQVFLTFLKIGIFTFGGGYAMVALIQNEVVGNHAWMTAQEFTDLLAISQITPGPIGINTATYAGYTAVINAGYSQTFAIAGAILASVAVILLPVLLMIVVSGILQRHRNNPLIETMFQGLRLAIVGVIASAALILFSNDNFGSVGFNRQFILSCIIFIAVFYLSSKKKASPILLILSSAIVGLVAYSI